MLFPQYFSTCQKGDATVALAGVFVFEVFGGF